MPPDSTQHLNAEHRMPAGQLAMVGILVLLLGIGAWLYFDDRSTPPSTHADFYRVLVTENTPFAEAEALATQMRFAEALPLYQDALRSATHEEQRLQIKLLIARMMVQTGAYAEAVPILKEIVATGDNPRISRGRAAAVEEIAGIYARGIPDLNDQIFKDEPFTSLLDANGVDITLRHLHEYAASIYPIAVPELWIAQWYAYQLPHVDATSRLSPDTIRDYKVRVAQSLSAADSDISYMQRNGTMDADLRYALLMRAIVTGMLFRKGDISFGDVHAQFANVTDMYAQIGQGYDCPPRYHYALFLAQTYGTDKKTDIQVVLEPLSEEAYAQTGSCSFLQEARDSGYYRQFPKLIANIDADFKSYLMTLGWTEADFSS